MTQFENLGDEVINAVLARELAGRMKLVALTRGVPDWYLSNMKDHLGAIDCNVEYYTDSAAFIRKSLSVSFGGGRNWLFTSCGDVSASRSNYKRDGSFAALQYLPSLRLASVGASYSRISTSKAWLLRLASRRGKAISVRDTRSQDLLAANGVEVKLVPDLAFKLPWVKSPSERRRALFTFREIAGQNAAYFAGKLRNIVRILSDAGISSVMTWQVGRDEAYCRSLATELGIRLEPASEGRNRFRKTCDFYDGADIIFSNRLHALLIAASRGAVPVAVLHAEERKIRGIFEDNGMDLYLMPSEGEGHGRLPEVLQTLPRHCDVVKTVFSNSSASIDAYFDDLAGAGK
ncbi:polysaccharide pyruvyl transferase family protein [Affinirhizobium pseudoryzae]|uniref:polysaccharide pyruvyl transferase family protein n=1 Tax=Allorhizobium pseudoryzae TaxID=379684 RepID=UPI0013EA099A|nr:polysaccharide pyruvyl transferase family protein [Allorhizobium pseudoryzae]